MGTVQFDEEPSYMRIRPTAGAPKQRSIIGLMYTLGVAKTQKDATVILSGIIVVCVIMSATVFFMVQPHPHPVSQQQLSQDLARMRATTNTPIPSNI